MDDDAYLTLADLSKGLFKEKGSKFLSFAFPVTQEQEVKEHLQALKKIYYDARHCCYAYILDKNIYRVSDDGEPMNSAGNPILGQIRSKNLSNVLIVVVRYFGGTKLGVSGLVNAYKTAASSALENGKIITAFKMQRGQLQFQYPKMNEAMKLIKEFELKILTQKFELNCLIQFEGREKKFIELEERIKLMSGIFLKRAES
ncbi:MAG: YigZ family protein [Bacteroidota bacterium]